MSNLDSEEVFRLQQALLNVEQALAKKKQENAEALAKKEQENAEALAKKEQENAEALAKKDQENAEALAKKDQENAEALAKKEQENAEALAKKEQENAEALAKVEQEKAVLWEKFQRIIVQKSHVAKRSDLVVWGPASNCTTLSDPKIKNIRYASCWSACQWSLELVALLNVAPSNPFYNSFEPPLPTKFFQESVGGWQNMIVAFHNNCKRIGVERDGPYGAPPPRQPTLLGSPPATDETPAPDTVLSGLFAYHVVVFLATERKQSGLIWVHQAPTYYDRRCKVDGLLLLTSEETDYHTPILFLELVMNTSVAPKRAQAFAMASKMLTDTTKAILGLLISLPHTPWGSQVYASFELRLYCRSSIEDKHADILLDKGRFDLSSASGWGKFAQLLACSDVLAKHVTDQFKDEMQPIVHPRCTVLQIGKFGFKAFRKDKLLPNQVAAQGHVQSQRKWEYDAKLLRGANILVDNDTGVLIVYEWTSGSHQASNTTQFADVLRHLAELHSKAIIHGDIKLSNIVFGSGEQGSSGCLIDFDISGVVDGTSSYYPATFNRNIFDGQRHPTATANAKLQFEHDCFAMAAVMELFVPDDPFLQATWQDLIHYVRDSSVSRETRLSDAIAAVNNMNAAIHLKESVKKQLMAWIDTFLAISRVLGTGSPPELSSPQNAEAGNQSVSSSSGSHDIDMQTASSLQRSETNRKRPSSHTDVPPDGKRLKSGAPPTDIQPAPDPE